MQDKIIKKALVISQQKSFAEKWQSTLSDLKYFESRLASARTPALKQSAQKRYDIVKAFVDAAQDKMT